MAGSCAFSSSLSLALGSLRSPCWDTVQPARAIKGVEVKVPVRLSPDLKGSLCGTAVAWPVQVGQVWNRCRPFILRVAFPDAVAGAGKYTCS